MGQYSGGNTPHAILALAGKGCNNSIWLSIVSVHRLASFNIACSQGLDLPSSKRPCVPSRNGGSFILRAPMCSRPTTTAFNLLLSKMRNPHRTHPCSHVAVTLSCLRVPLAHESHTPRHRPPMYGPRKAAYSSGSSMSRAARAPAGRASCTTSRSPSAAGTRSSRPGWTSPAPTATCRTRATRSWTRTAASECRSSASTSGCPR